MTDIITRFATSNDMPALVQMQVEFERFFQNIGSCERYDIDTDARARDLYDIHFGPNSFVRTILAIIDNQIVGRVSFYRGYTAEVPPFYHIQLSGVYVKDGFRGRGVMKVMFNRLREIAATENMKMIKWSVWGQNKNAVRSYEKLGAQYFADAWDEHFMFLEI